MWLYVLLAVLAGYLLGNLNGSIIMSQLLDHKDVRDQGSGNAGLTNFLRMYGPSSAIAVIAIDMVKAFSACLIGKALLAPHGYALEGVLIGGLSVNIGHDFPAFFGFRGGKGVLCGITAALAADWQCALLVIAVFALCLWLTRYVSLSSILGSATFAISFAIVHWGQTYAVIMGIALPMLIIFMHRSNIGRLLKGTERKATFSKFRKNK